MPEVITIALGEISPSDLPQEDSWNKVQSLNPISDLNQLGIKITSGFDHPYVPLDGNHRLARLVQVMGELAIVSFTLLPPYNDKESSGMDWLVETNREFGVPDFPTFIQKCLQGDYLAFKLRQQKYFSDPFD